MNAIEALQQVKSELPKRIPDKFFARNRDDSPWSMGYNDAIGVCRDVIDEKLRQLTKGTDLRLERPDAEETA